jgi:hypothetical protein
MLNTLYRTYIKPIDLNIIAKNLADDKKKKYYDYDKPEYFAKNYKQLKKL